MKPTALLFVATPLLLTTLAACSSDDEPAPPATVEASVSAVLPGRAFLSRKLDVTISGSATKWDEATTVDFGEGITVDDLVVASPTALVARITVEPTATTGARDVTVNGGGVASVYKGAFTVDAPMTLAVKGTPAQGSVFFMTATNKDLSTPFDTTAESSLFSVTYTGITVPELEGMTFQISSVSGTATELAVLTDLDVEAGTKAFSIESGVEGSEKVSFPFPAGLEIAARTPVELVPGTAAKTDATKPFESGLYKITPGSGLNIVDVDVTSGAARFVLLPKSGKIADAVTGFGATATLLTTNSDPYYAIALDTSGEPGAFSLKSTVTSATLTQEGAGNNDTKAQAEAVATLPAIIESSISALADEDWFAITATAGDVGKTLSLMTAPGDANTDTLLTVYRSDGTTELGTSDDADYHDKLDTDPLPAAETYYVKVTQSSQTKTWSASASKYRLVVRIK